MDRRTFIGTTAGALLTGSTTKVLASSPESKRIGKIGLQLYTVRDQMKDSVPNTLAAVAKAGYKEVEFAGYFGHSAGDIRKMLDDLGLAAPAAHVQMPQLGAEWGSLLEQAKTIGHEYLVCAWIDANERTIPGYRAIAARFNKAGHEAMLSGVKLGYHNYSFEFTPIDGVVPYDLLLKECDPIKVAMEIDVFWMTQGGGDPVKYMERYPGRFPMLHMKDMGPAPRRAMLDVGKGTINWKMIFRAGESGGVKHAFVENDETKPPLASIKTSYRYLDALRF
ncbi:MAG TPA: sugar phosphate isomerase/epimerase [Gemmatimonadaceae bacterium]|nr:sugar phosphate isomerase/epimerase [Gemmatimonadaceae bacterium]